MDPETCSRGNAHGSEKHGAAAAAQALPPQAEGGYRGGSGSHRCCRHGSTDVAASAFAETKPPANGRAIG